MKYFIIIASILIAISCGDRGVTFSTIPQADIDNPVEPPEAPPSDSTPNPSPTIPPEVIDELDDALGGIRAFEGLGLVTFNVLDNGRINIYGEYFDFSSVLTQDGLGVGLDVRYLGNNFYIKRGGVRYTEYIVTVLENGKFVLTIRIFKGKLRTNNIGEVIYEESFNEL